MHLFIDTNIFLRFYGYTNDRLEELKKLNILIDKGEITLYVPSQLRDEIARKREAEIKKTYKDLVELRLEKGFPYIFRSHDDFSALLKALDAFYETKKKILEGLEKDIREKKLPADLAIAELLSKGQQIDCKKFLEPARIRIQFGKPPGKEGKLGDAINWECLLASVPHKADLFLVSKDSDYQSPINSTQLDGYLQDEWHTKKKSTVYFYQSLTDWASRHQKDILLKLEDEKSTLIDRLLQSGTFAETHLIIENLAKHTDFSVPQIDQLLSAAAFNSQVRSILTDQDVKEFYQKIISGHEAELNQELLEIAKRGLEENKAL